MTKWITVSAVAVVVVAVAVAYFTLRGGESAEPQNRPEVTERPRGKRGGRVWRGQHAVPERRLKKKGSGSVAAKASEGKADENESPEALSEEEQRARDEEKSVEAFDELTDKWMEPAKEGVTMKDVDEFVSHFRKVPKERRDECLHRALNLVPDENIMLLAGILMDKTQDKELIETVYNDVLNRGEGVKKPILQQIFKDREHPCWADTAWILDVTGELPTKK